MKNIDSNKFINCSLVLAFWLFVGVGLGITSGLGVFSFRL